MAIKKGAFELYAQERKLPKKNVNSTIKASHFFDDTYTKAKSSQLVHNQFTSGNDLGTVSQNNPKELPNQDDTGNSSQLVHNQFTNGNDLETVSQNNPKELPNQDNTGNSSQLVHNQFTNGNDLGTVSQNNPKELPNQDNTGNSSQLVHNQFTNGNDLGTVSQNNPKELPSQGNTGNSSQSVHNQFTSSNDLGTVSQNDPKELPSQGTTGNSSQSVHNQFTKIDALITDNSTNPSNNQSKSNQSTEISFSKLVGNQRKILIALYKNMRMNKSDSTEELTLELISKITGVNQKSLKNTLFRLTKAGILIRVDQKAGRGGWVKFAIDERLIEEIQQKEFLR